MAGREKELEQLGYFIDSVSKGQGLTVLISGEAGSGKTRLAREFLKSAESNLTILSGCCLSNSAIPYFPFVEAFNSYPTVEKRVLAYETQSLKFKGYLTRQLDYFENQDFRQSWKDQTFASVTSELLSLSEQKPVVVFIDDIHWADSASLSLLQYISRAIACERILLLATFRSEELDAQFDVQRQSLGEMLRVMRRENLYSEIKLGGLGNTEIGSIAKSMLGGSVSPELIKKLTVESAGNPLFVVESLKFLAEKKGLAKEDDCWVVQNGQFGVPTKVKDVILRRLNIVTPQARDVLDAGSVVGDRFDAKLIGAILEQSTVQVLSVLNSISKTKSLVVCESDWFRFDHPKTREVLYEEISLPLKREYHLRIAKTLEQRLSDYQYSFGDLAYHYISSGNKPLAIKYSLEAGKDALSRFSNSEAIRHFTYVLNALGYSDKSIEKETALEGLGDAYHASMMFQEAIDTYKQLAVSEGPTRVRALRKAMECAFFKNSHDVQKAFLKEIEVCEISDEIEKAKILMNKARVASREGNLSLSIEYFESGLELAENAYSEWDVAWILVGLGSTLVWMGQQEKAIAALLRAGKIFDDLADRRWLIESYNAIGNALISHLGFGKEGMIFLSKAAQVDDEAKVNDYLRLAQLNASWGRALGVEGDLHGALSKSLEALSYAEKTDSGWGKGVVYSNLTMFYSALGDTKKTAEYYHMLMSLPEDVQRNSYVSTPLAKAAYLASGKQWIEATSILVKLLPQLESISAQGIEAIARLYYAEILRKQGIVEQANQQRKVAQSIFDNIRKRFEKANVYLNLMVKTSLSSNETAEMRIDIVNASRRPIFLESLIDFIPVGCQVRLISSGAILEDGTIKFDDQTLESFSVKSVKLSMHFSRAGIYNVTPKTIFADEVSEKYSSAARTVKIQVDSPQKASDKVNPKKINFNSEAAEKIYDFLVQAFQQDYTQRKLSKDHSGWRSLMNIVRGAKISRYCIYGFPNFRGQAISELERLGLIEVRLFEGERGRGGKITKARALCYNGELELQ